MNRKVYHQKDLTLLFYKYIADVLFFNLYLINLHFSFFNRITNNTLYIVLSCIFRVVAGIAIGLVSVPSFGVLTKMIPTRVAFVTALAEAALNGAQAFGPFMGSLLYDAGGYR